MSLKIQKKDVSSTQSLSLEDWKVIHQSVKSLVLRAAADSSLRQNLLTDPLPHLRELGLNFPEGVEVCFSEQLMVPWELMASPDAQSVLYSMRLPTGQPELRPGEFQEQLYASNSLTALYSMCSPLQSESGFPNLEKQFSPSIVLANLEMLFLHSDGEVRMPLPSNWREQGNAVARLIAQAWMDDEFKAQFMANPVPELERVGVSIPEGLAVEVVEGLDAPWKIVASDDAQSATYSINVPAKPGDISDDDLRSAISDRAARICSHCYCCC